MTKYFSSVHDLEPEVFPLSGIEIDPPMIVRALKGNGGVKKGEVYLLRYVLNDGRVLVYKNTVEGVGNPMRMQDFVRMIAAPKAANDDATKK